MEQYRQWSEVARGNQQRPAVTRAATSSAAVFGDALWLLDVVDRLYHVPINGSSPAWIDTPGLARSLTRNEAGLYLLTVAESDPNEPQRVWRRSQNQWSPVTELELPSCIVDTRIIGVGPGWAVFTRDSVHFAATGGRAEHFRFAPWPVATDSITCSQDGWCLVGFGLPQIHSGGTLLFVDLVDMTTGIPKVPVLCSTRMNDAAPDPNRQDCILVGLGRQAAPGQAWGCAVRSCRSAEPTVVFQLPAFGTGISAWPVLSVAPRSGGTVYRTHSGYFEVAGQQVRQLAAPTMQLLGGVPLSTDLRGLVVVDVSMPGSSTGPELRLLEHITLPQGR